MKKFSPPRAEEVSAYAKSIGFKLDGQEFCDYYASVGWLVGVTRKPMCDWKAAVRYWRRRQNESGAASQAVSEYQAEVRRRQAAQEQREKYLEEYAEQIAAAQSWRGRADCPYGDPEDVESRLWQKALTNFGPVFIRDLRRLVDEINRKRAARK